MPSLDHIRSCLAAHDPPRRRAPGAGRAAVALLLRPGPADAELLLIERARHEADPWSGHMALPGGRVDAGDASDRHAAERETLEEVGIGLGGCEYWGRLLDLEGRHAGRPAGLVISAHVWHVPGSAPLRLNYEVAEAFWFPLSGLLDPSRRVEVESPHLPGSRFPGILVGVPDRQVVWGLTYRFLEALMQVLGLALPGPADASQPVAVARLR